MEDLAPVLVCFAMCGAIVVPIILKMVFKHQQEMAEIAAQGNASPQVLAEVQELKKQLADLRELVTDLALNTPAVPSIQSRVGQQKLQ